MELTIAFRPLHRYGSDRRYKHCQVLAQACDARLVIVDDKRARRAARERGLVLVGTLGVLVRARQQGYLLAVRPVLDAMMAQGRHISATLREQTLRAVGESKHDEG